MSTPPPPAAGDKQPTLLGHVASLDRTWSHTIHTYFHPKTPRILLKLLELTGDGRLWFPTTLSLLLSPLRSHSPPLLSFSLSLLAGLLLDILLIGSLKHLIRRPRPAYNPRMGPTFAVDHWSFPSGHASRVCFVAAFFALSLSTVEEGVARLRTVGEERWVEEWESTVAVRWVVGWVWVWAVMTSVSRVLLGRHYVFDVLVGAAVGVGNAFFVYRFLRF